MCLIEQLNQLSAENNDMRQTIKMLRTFVDDVLPQVGQLVIQDFGNLNSALIASEKYVKDSGLNNE